MHSVKKAAILFVILSFTSFSFAHLQSSQSIWERLSIPDPVTIVLASAVMIILATAVSVIFRNSLDENGKKIIFVLIAAPAIISTLYLAGSTVYLNVNSETGGPVHWHADYEVWSCGKEYELRDPQGLESFVGIPLLHEHNDKRIHAEGVPLKTLELSVKEYLHAVGGDIGDDYMIFPSSKGDRFWRNGDMCNGKPAELQVFLYKITNPQNTKNWEYTQTKMKPQEATEYIMSPHTNIPPGDCIIFEFDAPKEKAGRVCTSYQIAIEKGELKEKS